MTVDTAVSASGAFYFNYANESTFSNRLGIYELLTVGAFNGWALLVIILSLVSASELWQMTDNRLAEAEAESIGVETPIRLDLAIKTATLCMVLAFGVVVSAYSLGDTANELVSWFDKYDDDTNSEGTANGASDKDPAGTSA